MTVATTRFRFSGKLDSLDGAARNALFDRTAVSDRAVTDSVRDTIDRVSVDGDRALLEFAARFDGVQLDKLEVSQDVIRTAANSIDGALKRAMVRSARNIERVHVASRPMRVVVEVEPGIVVERRPDPLARVGIYAPGGTAAYASSVLMAAIPAKVAGVGELILCSPPSSDGNPSAPILAAAKIAGIDRIFSLGGAGAIAAMALGTRTVPRVDRVVGPGNAYVAEAKLQLMSRVGIDCPAGPSELVVIADESADPALIAREVMAQAEHDVRAVVVVIALGSGIAEAIEAAIVRALSSQPRRRIIEEALVNGGGVLVANSLEAAIAAANEFAPEHLLIAARDAESITDKTRSAGTVFIGESSSVAFGDYISGANHVLPTGGLARWYSGLSTLDFVRWTTTQTISSEGAASLAEDAAAFATAEGLPGHASAARAWSLQ